MTVTILPEAVRRRALVAAALLAFQGTALAQDRWLVDWDAAGREAVDLVVDLVQIESVNPPGNESRVVEYLETVLAAEDIPYELYEKEPGRANLVARYRGNGAKPPILIMGHTDVVGVQADRWSEPPFSGLRKDGYIWGRGTLDDKDNVAAGLLVLLLLHRLDVDMDRDIIFLAEAGEEGTPEAGITFMVEEHWDAIAAESYLSGSEKGKTRIFTQNRVTIGTSETCDLKLVPEEGGTLPEGVLADIYDDGGSYHLAPEQSSDGIEIRVNGEEVNGDLSAPGYALQDGDSIQFGHGLSSASLLFQVMPENFTTAQLARRTGRALDQPPAQPVHPLTATLFVKELTASLWAEIPRRIKLIALISTGLVVLVFLFAVYFNFLILHRNASEIERLRQQTAQEVARRQQDQDIIRSQQDELNRLREMSEQARRFAQKISERYSPGVCLIVGSYSFVERGTGRVLKYEAADDANETPVDANGNLLASVDGAGPPVRIEYTGTGFVIEEGVISTNKHVVRPWASDAIAQIILQQGGGFRPQLDTLMAFFPSIQTPFKLREVIVSQRYDIALCSFEQGDAAIPVIPLSRDDPQSIIGDPVVLLGYPTGVDGLLQRIDENERREILKLNGGSAEEVAAGLAERGLIRPLTTTGTISDALPGRIVHSAQTTEGGSGSPMFDRDGQVIAVNSAILTTIDGTQSFGGSNFGVPVKMVNDLLAAYRRGQTTLD